MRYVPVVLLTAALAGCASSGGRTATIEDPELFRHTYTFSGTVNGQALEGRFWFRQMGDPVPLELNMTSAAAGNCRSEMRVLNMSHMVLRCGGISLEFVRRGRVVEQPNVAWTTVQQQQRRGCARWVVGPGGQRTCAMEGTETFDVTVTVRGSVRLTRLEG